MKKLTENSKDVADGKTFSKTPIHIFIAKNNFFDLELVDLPGLNYKIKE